MNNRAVIATVAMAAVLAGFLVLAIPAQEGGGVLVDGAMPVDADTDVRIDDIGYGIVGTAAGDAIIADGDTVTVMPTGGEVTVDFDGVIVTIRGPEETVTISAKLLSGSEVQALGIGNPNAVLDLSVSYPGPAEYTAEVTVPIAVSPGLTVTVKSYASEGEPVFLKDHVPTVAQDMKAVSFEADGSAYYAVDLSVDMVKPLPPVPETDNKLLLAIGAIVAVFIAFIIALLLKTH